MTGTVCTAPFSTYGRIGQPCIAGGLHQNFPALLLYGGIAGRVPAGAVAHTLRPAGRCLAACERRHADRELRYRVQTALRRKP